MSTPPATQYSISLRVSLDNVPGVLGRLAASIGEAGGNIYAVDSFVAKGSVVVVPDTAYLTPLEAPAETIRIVRDLWAGAPG